MPTHLKTVLAGILVLASYVAARVAAERLAPGSPMLIALVVLPIAPFAWLMLLVIDGIRRADELERRIHLEALAVAFPLTVLMLMLLGLLELATDLDPANWSYRHLWPYAVLFWFAGIALARRRYA